MERLTYDFCHNGVHCNQVKGADNMECREVCNKMDTCDECPISRAFDRLASIEDILGDDYDLDRLRELVEAERDGRCVALPCKVGDKVWIVRTARDGKSTKEVFGFGKIKRIYVDDHGTFLVGDYCHTLNAERIGKTAFTTREAAEQATEVENMG